MSTDKIPSHVKPLTRSEVFDARSVEDLFRRLRQYFGRPPTGAEMRAWTNTVLGPWDIPAHVLTECESTP